jgi:hypothetical protein
LILKARNDPARPIDLHDAIDLHRAGRGLSHFDIVHLSVDAVDEQMSLVIVLATRDALAEDAANDSRPRLWVVVNGVTVTHQTVLGDCLAHRLADVGILPEPAQGAFHVRRQQPSVWSLCVRKTHALELLEAADKQLPTIAGMGPYPEVDQPLGSSVLQQHSIELGEAVLANFASYAAL